MTAIPRLTLVAPAVLSVAAPAFDLPPLTAHTNGMNGVTWPGVPFNMLNPSADAHQHWRPDHLFSTPGKFRTDAAWDNNHWRYDEVNDRPITKAGGSMTDDGRGVMERPAGFSIADRATLGMARINAVRAADPGTLDGARDAIAIPSPGPAALMALGLLIAARRKRA